MRSVLLRPLRKALGVSIVEEDSDWSRIAENVKDDWESDSVARDFSVAEWFSNQACAPEASVNVIVLVARSDLTMMCCVVLGCSDVPY
jgi:hypothetical protein